MAMPFTVGLILDATLRAIIDAIWDLFRGKHGIKIDARTILDDVHTLVLTEASENVIEINENFCK